MTRHFALNFTIQLRRDIIRSYHRACGHFMKAVRQNYAQPFALPSMLGFHCDCSVHPLWLSSSSIREDCLFSSLGFTWHEIYSDPRSLLRFLFCRVFDDDFQPERSMDPDRDRAERQKLARKTKKACAFIPALLRRIA